MATPLGTPIKFATSYKMALAGGLSAMRKLTAEHRASGDGFAGLERVLLHALNVRGLLTKGDGESLLELNFFDTPISNDRER